MVTRYENDKVIFISVSLKKNVYFALQALLQAINVDCVFRCSDIIFESKCIITINLFKDKSPSFTSLIVDEIRCLSINRNFYFQYRYCEQNIKM